MKENARNNILHANQIWLQCTVIHESVVFGLRCSSAGTKPITHNLETWYAIYDLYSRISFSYILDSWALDCMGISAATTASVCVCVWPFVWWWLEVDILHNTTYISTLFLCLSPPVIPPLIHVHLSLVELNARVRHEMCAKIVAHINVVRIKQALNSKANAHTISAKCKRTDEQPETKAGERIMQNVQVDRSQWKENYVEMRYEDAQSRCGGGDGGRTIAANASKFVCHVNPCSK